MAVTSRRWGPDVDVETTAKALEEYGAQALALELDLADRASIDAALDEIESRWGAISVLVNNALCDQPGSQVQLTTVDFDAFEKMIVGEVVNTAYLTRQVLGLAGATATTVINVGSAAAHNVPRNPIGQGFGWAFSYSATKAALHRLAPFVQLEYRDRGVRAFTVDPGLVRTEALLERLGDIPGSAPPQLPADVIDWLAFDPGADAYLGQYVHAQDLAAELGWRY